MKRQIVMAFLFLGLCARADTTYEEIEFNQLKIAPETYKMKYVEYYATYRNFTTTFLPYMEASGFKSTRYVLLDIGDSSVPVIAKKNEELNALVAEMKRGSHVLVRGRVREFKQDPRWSAFPRFYVDLDEVKIHSEPEVEDNRPWRPLQPQQRPAPPPRRNR